MAARLTRGVGALERLRLGARERLRRLSIVFAIEIRMKIVIEAYMREISAKQFFREFGGGSASRVSQNFTRLTSGDWLRFLYSRGPGGARRGGEEHFYRATELPFIDSESWALVPFSVRAITTWNFLRQVMPRLRGDIEGSMAKDASSRELTCTTFEFDEVGWKRAASAVSDQFVSLFEEQEDARRRVVHSGEQLMRADVFLIAFEPVGSTTNLAVVDRLVECRREPATPFLPRLAPILADDLQLEIIARSHEQEVSVTQFHREVEGMNRPALSRRFKGLERGGWLGKGVRKNGGARRGAYEQFFRPTKPVIHRYDPSADPLSRLVGAEARQAFEALNELATEALIAGTLDMRTERCLSWSLIRLDRQGWENVIAGIESLYEFIVDESRQAKSRLGRSGEAPIPLAVGLAAFEAPTELLKAP